LEITQDLKDRIVAAANALYEARGRAEFPTVAAVRASAGTDMNVTSVVMRAWRQAQSTQTTPVPMEIAEAMEDLRRELEDAQARIAELTIRCDTDGQELAEARQAQVEAQARADESERWAADLQKSLARKHDEADAERGMQAEDLVRLRTELDQLHAELVEVRATAEAEAEQAADQLRRFVEEAQVKITQLTLVSETTAGELAQARNVQRAVEVQAAIALQRAEESERRVAELKQELAREQDEGKAERLQLVEQRRQWADATQRAAERLAELQAERDQARKEAGAAREEAAKLQGRAEALGSQLAELLRTVMAQQDAGAAATAAAAEQRAQ
jgi:colicin import membrane protein